MIGAQEAEAGESSHSSIRSEGHGVNQLEKSEDNKSTPEPETQFPASVSIDQLLLAGKLVKPLPKKRVVLELESFDIKNREWQSAGKLELLLEIQKFSSGGFRDAFKGVTDTSGEKQTWVVKTYNERAVQSIEKTLKTTVDSHTRKQV